MLRKDNRPLELAHSAVRLNEVHGQTGVGRPLSFPTVLQHFTPVSTLDVNDTTARRRTDPIINGAYHNVFTPARS